MTASTVANDITSLISKAELDDVKSGISARYNFRMAGYTFEILAESSLVVATILFALEGKFNNEVMRTVAIVLNVCALGFQVVKVFCLRESRSRTQEVNIIAKKLGLEELPDVILEEEMENRRLANVNLRAERRASDNQV